MSRIILVFPSNTEVNIIKNSIHQAVQLNYELIILKLIPEQFFTESLDSYADKISDSEVMEILSIYKQLDNKYNNTLFNIELGKNNINLLNIISISQLFVDYYHIISIPLDKIEIMSILPHIKRIDLNLIHNENSGNNIELTKEDIGIFTNNDIYSDDISDSFLQLYKSYPNHNLSNKLDSLKLIEILKDFYRVPAIFVYKNETYNLFLFGIQRYYNTSIKLTDLIEYNAFLSIMHKFLLIHLSIKEACSECIFKNRCLLEGFILFKKINSIKECNIYGMFHEQNH